MGVSRSVIVGSAGLILATIVPITLFGFTVDDALISCRYAHHIATGEGYRFNIGGPMTDGVTPLPWPWILAIFAHAGPLPALYAAKVLGIGAWALAAAWMSVHIDGLARRRLDWPHLALLVAFATPAIGAGAASGMETGLATAVSTVAVLSIGSMRARAAGAFLAGVACTLRPELLPWACAVAVGHARCSQVDEGAERVDAAQLARRLAGFSMLAITPFAVVALVRLAVFGAAAPLSILAKPSDLHHGWMYVAAGLIVAGPFAAVIAPIAWLRIAPWPRWLLVAAGVHCAAIAVAGGDWMPLSRLLVPVLPSLAIVFAHIAAVSRAWSTIGRWLLCAAGQVFVFWRVGPDAASVMSQRLALIEQLSAHLESSDRVATVDIGWVGASFPGTVIDLAGVTDPRVAGLPGGHTTKAIPSLLLAEREATLLVLQLPVGISQGDAWRAGEYERGVEVRVASNPWVHEHFEAGYEVRASDRLRYGVLSRRPKHDVR